MNKLLRAPLNGIYNKKGGSQPKAISMREPGQPKDAGPDSEEFERASLIPEASAASQKASGGRALTSVPADDDTRHNAAPDLDVEIGSRRAAARAPLTGMVAINLRLPPDLHEEYKVIAFENRTSLQRLIVEAMTESLSKYRFKND